MNTKYKIVQTDNGSFPPVLDAVDLRRFNAVLRLADARTEKAASAACRDADLVLATRGVFSREVINGLRRCAAIIRLGVGVEKIDLEAATGKGIVVANVPDFCLDEVSDTVVAMILALNRKILLLHHSVLAGSWDRRLARPISRLRGQTLGLVGFGRIARAVAAKMRAFGTEIIAYDPYCAEEVIAGEKAAPVSLEQLLARSDFISLHVPLTIETHHLITADQLFRMKRSAYLINTSRGEVVDSGALHAALRKGWLAGAALDVLEGEPPQGRVPLIGLPNVIVTPHFASYSEEAFGELVRKVRDAAIRVLRGKFPEHMVNPEVKRQARLSRRRGG